MAFVDKHQKVLGKIVQKRIGRVARLTAVKIPAVIFNTCAKADLAHHFNIIARALAQPKRVKRLSLVLQLLGAYLQVALNPVDVLAHFFAIHRIMCGGEHQGVLKGA